MEHQFSLHNIGQAADLFWRMAGQARVFSFSGEMGAGKTTFILALCRARGIRDLMGSPTFSIINEYELPGAEGPEKLYHMDLYRLNSAEEAVQAGVEDCLYSGNICLVEWPEKAPGIFPPEAIKVTISIADSATRKFQIDGN